jgi:hypothetical protein
MAASPGHLLAHVPWLPWRVNTPEPQLAAAAVVHHPAARIEHSGGDTNSVRIACACSTTATASRAPQRAWRRPLRRPQHPLALPRCGRWPPPPAAQAQNACVPLQPAHNGRALPLRMQAEQAHQGWKTQRAYETRASLSICGLHWRKMAHSGPVSQALSFACWPYRRAVKGTGTLTAHRPHDCRTAAGNRGRLQVRSCRLTASTAIA